MPQAHIPCQYFYDDVGSALFVDITHTRAYYVTRTERAIMQAHLPSMGLAMNDLVGGVRTVVELGAGACEKALPLCRAVTPLRFVGFDVAAAFMARGAQRLRQAMPWMGVHTVGADILKELPMPSAVPKAGRLMFYPGTSLGNFLPDVAVRLLQRMRSIMGAHGGLLLGIDLIKPIHLLERAYDDEDGVTAAFNLNALTHVNHVIEADFDIRHWQHVAEWNPAKQRVEMYLQSMRAQGVRWCGGQRGFKRGERILTEFSHKYTIAGIGRLLGHAGMAMHRVWTDPNTHFAVVLARSR